MSSSVSPLVKQMRRSLAALVLLTLTITCGCALLTQPVSSTTQRGPRVVAEPQELSDSVLALARPRDVKDLVALDAMAEYLTNRLRALGFEPHDQPFTYEGKTYRNVRVVTGDPKAPRVVVGAHYDSYGPLPAADDNASGVAVVLELARILQTHPAPGAVELVFWTLEEPPVYATEFMGSVIHAKALTAESVKVTGVLSIETVGFYSDDEGSQHFPAPGLAGLYSTTGNYVALVSNLDNVSLVRAVKKAMQSTQGIPVMSINSPAVVPGIDWSDHRSYWPQDLRALMVTDTAANRNANYHQPTDTPDTLNYVKMARLTEALFEAVWVLTENLEAVK